MNRGVRSGVLAAKVVLALAAIAAGPARASAESSEGTVTTREVRPGDRLEVDNYEGSVSLAVWDRNEIRVEATRTSDEIRVTRSGSRVRVVPASWERDAGGFEIRLPDMARVRVVGESPPPADLDVRLPVWMPVVVRGPFIDVSASGLRSSLEVTILKGRMEARSSEGSISVVIMHGDILVEDGSGDLRLEGGRRPVTVRSWAGDLRVETTTGDVRLEEVDAQQAEVTTVDGRVSWKGPLQRDGSYEISTHGGDIDLLLDGTPDAEFSARTYMGRIETTLAPEAPPGQKRIEFTSGDGRGTVRLTSFDGTIRIVDPSRQPSRP